MFRLVLCLAVVSFATADKLYFKPASPKALADITCGDKKTTCPKTSTCCALATGGYGCCPLPQAVCCSDNIHCCPHGDKFDVKQGRCLSAAGVSRPWLEKRPGKQLQGEVKSVICPGGQYQCPDGSTCCKQSSGGWGCCPFPQATCCADHRHCCPNGYKCDAAHSTCVKAGASKVLLTKTQEATRVKTVGATVKKTSPLHTKATPKKDSVLEQKRKAALRASQIKAKEHIKPSLATKTGSVNIGKDVPKKVATSVKSKLTQTNVKLKQPPPKATVGGSAVKKKVAQQPPVAKKQPVKQTPQIKKAQAATPKILKTVTKEGKAQKQPPPPKVVAKKVSTPQEKKEVPPKAKGSSASKSGKKDKKKEGKKMMEHITDTIQATVTAIKDTMQRVVSGSAKKGASDTKKGEKGNVPKPKTVVTGTTKPAKAVHSDVKKKAVEQLKKVATQPHKPTTAAKAPPPRGKATPQKVPIKLQPKTPMQAKEAQQKLLQQKLAQQKAAQQKISQKKLAKPSLEKVNQQKAAQQKVAQQKMAQQKVAQQKMAQHKVAQQKVTQQKMAQHKVAQQKVAHEKLKQQKLSQEKLAQVKMAQKKSLHEKNAPKKFETKTSQTLKQQQNPRVAKVQQVKTQVSKQAQEKAQAAKLKLSQLQKAAAQKLQQSKLQKPNQPKVMQSAKVHQQKAQAMNLKQKATKLQQQQKQQQQQAAQAMKHQQQKVQHLKQTKPKTQHMGTGRKLLGLAWRFLGVDPRTDEVIEENESEDQVEIKQLLDFEEGAGGDILLPEEEEVETVKDALEAKANKDITCPDKSTCPSDATCCELESGGYGCCPMKNAVCCEDHIHCCEHGEKCNVKAGSCDGEFGMTSELKKKLPASPPVGQSRDVKCDASTSCPAGQTCCKAGSGVWACCPLPKAVCCDDHTHCCPNGYTCGTGQCRKGSITIPWLPKKPAITRSKPAVSTIVCPDKKSECKDGSTCCSLESGSYGCCPYPKAVCCDDHEHCCPNGYTCGAGQCQKGSITIPWLPKKPAITRSEPIVSTIVCPDKKSECPDGSTCCLLSSGQYGCCPLPKAVCCDDHEHCCPNGYTCGAGQCQKGSITIPWLPKKPAITRSKPVVSTIVCPDQKSKCKDGSTCCIIPSGEYGCCPLPKAVCCSDHLHCCPEGSMCDVAAETCTRKGNAIPWSLKQPALTREPAETSIICPDKKSFCADGATCCLLGSGQWGCCPIRNAICCKDHLHCCPEGTHCAEGTGMCESTTDSKMVLDIASRRQVGIVKCSDGLECPDGSTCCQNSAGKYACCPHPEGVCCADKINCCPKGYTCDEKAQDKCKKGPSSLNSIFLRFPTKQASQIQIAVASVNCPDKETSCPNGNTCCALSAGGYGCCGIPDAVCCSTGFCCPKGHTCDASGQKCIVSVPMVSKISAKTIEPKNEKTPSSVACPNNQYFCQAGNTCCQFEGESWGCCALEEAVCCENGPYCCPKGMTCGQEVGVCVPKDENPESGKHTASFLRRAVKGGHILY